MTIPQKQIDFVKDILACFDVAETISRMEMKMKMKMKTVNDNVGA